MAARNIVSGEVANSSVGSSIDPLKTLYPAVNEEETPLPRSWSPKDKYNYIGLSLNNLRVHYKGTIESFLIPFRQTINSFLFGLFFDPWYINIS